MRVLHVISSGGMYGAEAVILNLCRALSDGPHRGMLGLLTTASNPSLELRAIAARQGLETHAIPCRGQIDPSVPRGIRELVRSTGADIVHAHGYKADVYVYLALRGSKTPLVSTCHTWYDNDVAVRLYGALDRLVLRSYTAVVAVSAEVKQRLLGAGVRPKRVHIIQNGIDLRPFSGVQRPQTNGAGSGRPLTVGLVGRLAPEKGVDLFLRAAAAVLPHAPHTRFVVAGDGPDRPSLAQLVAELGIGESTSLPGRNDDMPSFYAGIDLLVSSSRQEGLPVALLEGMASGLPVIATDVGDVSLVVRDGSSGVLVPSQDVGALTRAITTLLQEPDLRARYGQAAQDLIAKEFSAEQMAGRYLALYQAVGAGKASA